MVPPIAHMISKLKPASKRACAQQHSAVRTDILTSGFGPVFSGVFADNSWIFHDCENESATEIECYTSRFVRVISVVSTIVNVSHSSLLT